MFEKKVQACFLYKYTLLRGFNIKTSTFILKIKYFHVFPENLLLTATTKNLLLAQVLYNWKDAYSSVFTNSH